MEDCCFKNKFLMIPHEGVIITILNTVLKTPKLTAFVKYN